MFDNNLWMRSWDLVLTRLEAAVSLTFDLENLSSLSLSLIKLLFKFFKLEKKKTLKSFWDIHKMFTKMARTDGQPRKT